ncbi:MAG: c-type cytochrome [Betaproteobacteria bacterium]|jgi:sulfide dehydrogenase cytochrome subunit|nr:c-type cytochrome [Betaproteobacteria bacterium]
MKRSILAAALLTVAGTAFGQPADPNLGRNLAAACAICHGTNGVNAGGLPNLAGQHKDYMVQQLRDFRDGKRPATIMHQIAKGYTEPQIEALAAFFAAQKAK